VNKSVSSIVGWLVDIRNKKQTGKGDTLTEICVTFVQEFDLLKVVCKQGRNSPEKMKKIVHKILLDHHESVLGIYFS